MMLRPSLDPDQRKQVETAVVIAGLCAMVTGVINLGFDEIKAWRARRNGAERVAKETHR